MSDLSLVSERPLKLNRFLNEFGSNLNTAAFWLFFEPWELWTYYFEIEKIIILVKFNLNLTRIKHESSNFHSSFGIYILIVVTPNHNNILLKHMRQYHKRFHLFISLHKSFPETTGMEIKQLMHSFLIIWAVLHLIRLM